MWTLAATTCLLLGVLGSPVYVSQTPLEDPFYSDPGNLTNYGLGEIIRSRDVYVNPQLIESGGATQSMYRTNNTFNDPSFSVVTTFKPLSSAVTSYPQKVLSFQMFENAANLDCAPSYGLVKGLFSSNNVDVIWDVPIFVAWALAQGWYVVISDIEGPNSGFIVGHEEGKAGLDGIRAGLDQLGLPSDTEVALYGYSGAGHSTVWMSQLADSYAPDLNIIGAVHGGTPVDLETTINHLQNTIFSGFAVGGMAGVASIYPDFNNSVVQKYGNQFLKDAVKFAKNPDKCAYDLLFTYGSQSFTDKVISGSPYDSLLDVPSTQEVFGKESLLNNVSSIGVSTPKFPRMIYHGENDEVIPYEPIRQYVGERCEDGADIQFQVYPIGEHVLTDIQGIIPSMLFLQQLFHKETPKVKCGTAATDILTLQDPRVYDAIGKNTVEKIKALNGTKTPFGTIHLPNTTIVK